MQGGGGSGGGASGSSLDFTGWTAGQKAIYNTMIANGQKDAAKVWYEAATKSIKSNIPTPTPVPSGKVGGTYTPTFNTSAVPLKAGTTHTPDLQQSPLASTLGAAVPNINAPLGSSDNPHVFQKFNSGTASTSDWQTFGAMHTNQDKAAWDDPASYKHAYTYTATTNPYNKGAGGKKTKDVKGLQNAFKDSAVKPLEEWTVVGSSQDALFFTGANNIPIPDGSGHTLPFHAGGLMNTSVANQQEKLSGLIGQTFVQSNFVSAAIPVDKEFGMFNNIRVLFRLPPGSKGLYVSGNPNHKGKPISHFHEGEMEMVLPSYQTLKVISVGPSTAGPTSQYNIDVVVEVVNQPDV